VLVVFDFRDGGINARLIESAQQSHGDNTSLVAEYRPAEMCQVVEDDETDDADNEDEDADDQQQPHPRPDGSELWLVNWIEMLQTLNGHLHLDIAHPRVDHPQDNDQKSDDRLHDRVRQMNGLHVVDVTHIQRLLFIPLFCHFVQKCGKKIFNDNNNILFTFYCLSDAVKISM